MELINDGAEGVLSELERDCVESGRVLADLHVIDDRVRSCGRLFQTPRTTSILRSKFVDLIVR